MRYKKINYNLSDNICISNNGINAILKNGLNSSSAINIQTGYTYTIPTIMNRCAINNKGNEVVHYNEGRIYTYLDGKLWHRSTHQDPINGISFTG